MSYIYLTTNCEKRLPNCLARQQYTLIKSMFDGCQSIIVCKEPVTDGCCVLKTKQEAQAILDMWIDEENETPARDHEDKELIQSKIDLGRFC